MANGLLSDAPLNDPNYDYATILPFATRRDTGAVEFAVPGLLRDVGNSAVRMGQALRGERQLDAGNLFMDAIDFAPGALLAGRIAPKGATLGIFAGPRAETANRGLLAIAEDMAAKGANRDDIWRKTGWFNDVDGKWKFEIPDAKSSVVSNPQPVSGGQTVGDTFAHPDLYRAYSGESAVKYRAVRAELSRLKNRADYLKGVRENANKQGYEPFTADMKAELDALPEKIMQTSRDVFDARMTASEPINRIYKADHQGTSAIGSYEPGTVERIRVAANPETRPDEFRSVMLHELQHAVQQREGFGRGGNPTSLGDIKVVSDAWRRWQDNKPAVDEMQSILKSIEYADERKKINDLWSKEYAQKYEALDEKLDVPNVVGGTPHQGKTWGKMLALEDEYNARIRDMQPLYDRLVFLNKKYGVTAEEPKKYIDGYEAYRRLSGEVEARNVQTRADFSDAERVNQPPWTTRDIPEDEIIVRRNPNGTLAATPGVPAMGLLNSDNDNRPGGINLLGMYTGGVI